MTAMPMMLMTDEEVARFGRDDNAGFGALETARGLLPLVAMEVDARVAGVIASIEVAQTFVNTTGGAIEATYIFPLPDRAAVHRFRMEVGGRVIDGVVEERGAAREQYDAAIAHGHRAAITEEERSGVFTLRVGNLMPGDRATVHLSLVGPLPIDDGEVTLRFPLVVAPRYIPGAQLGGDQAGLGTSGDTALVPDASRISPPVLLPGCPNPVRLGLRVLLSDHDLRDVASSLHAVTTSKRDGLAIEVQPGERLDRDFLLRWRIDGAALTSTLTCADDADGRGGTFMLTLVPPSTLAVAAKPRDVVIVIDRSGSMGGWKMVAARRAAARMIDTLTSRDRFCAIAFDNVVDLVPATGLVDATDRHRFQAVEALAKLDARGGTELAEPLRRAASMLAGGTLDRQRVIVLVTDGQVGNEDHILRELVPHLRNVRMFTLGIDQAVNAAFLRRLAGAGGGLCELVESEDRLDAVMSKVHRRIGTPIATELAVRGTRLEIEPSSIAPKKLPDVYAGAPVTILGRYRGRATDQASIDVEGTSFGDPLRMTVARGGSSSESGPAGWLAASWARAAIRDREDQYAAGAHHLEHEIVTLSKTHGVLSRFTAFLAIDRSEVVNSGGIVRQVVQPVEEPAGWDMKTSGSLIGGFGGLGMPVARNMAMPAQAVMPQSGYPAPGFGPPPASPSPMGAMDMGGFAPPPPPGAPSGGGGIPGGPPPKVASREQAKRPMPPPARSGPSDNAAPVNAAPVNAAPVKMKRGRRRAEEGDAESASMAIRDQPADTAYLVQLAQLARELEAQGRGRADTAAIRLLRQRLVEWVEDVRSVGTTPELADAVERLVQRLSAALATATTVASEAIAIAGELATLAAGTPPTPRPASGRAFWK